ncbi:helix-turn-helix domain-containing protein [Acidithiobacillus ferrooxidans F221]|uniref:hypothetical protein n=1 Tax=Acidithiobacillus ferrooxidans TaxID=920 RepID=UPI001C068C0A|nr:hypothetical protein [Acidithiobacillus ferrooxidans]MBU2807592.1 helix-turn-helix domain-containing protein [Acidithiobacillus ferrooxidans F221]
MLNRALHSTVLSALEGAHSESLLGYTAEEISAYQSMMDPQEQRDADFLKFGDDDITDPAIADWCRPARLESESADADLGANYLNAIHDFESDDAIDKALHDAIYRTEKQEFNHHDRLLVDVPRSGRKKGGTHGLPPELRRTRSAKIVNEQLLRWDTPKKELLEAEAFYHACNARIARNAAYCLYKYDGPHTGVLALRLQGKSTKQIADFLGKTTRRIRQIINGNVQRNEKGLHQIIDELMQAGVPTDFQSDTPVLVQPVHARRESLQKVAALGQLAWDFDALVEVAA